MDCLIFFLLFKKLMSMFYGVFGIKCGRENEKRTLKGGVREMIKVIVVSCLVIVP